MDAQTLHDLQVRAVLGDAAAAHALRAEYARRDVTDVASLELERKYALPSSAGLAVKAGAERIITGYASTFENEARADAYGDIIAPGAYSEALARHAAGERRIRYLSQHDWNKVLGRPEVIREDDKGLWTESYTSQTPLGDEALVLTKDGALDSFSVGFYIRGYEIIERSDGTWMRKLTKLDLWEYSLVTFPANIYARISEVRSARQHHTPTPDQRALQVALANALVTLHTQALLEHA